MRTLKREHTLLPESSSDETENQEEDFVISHAAALVYDAVDGEDRSLPDENTFSLKAHQFRCRLVWFLLIWSMCGLFIELFLEPHWCHRQPNGRCPDSKYFYMSDVPKVRRSSPEMLAVNIIYLLPFVLDLGLRYLAYRQKFWLPWAHRAYFAIVVLYASVALVGYMDLPSFSVLALCRPIFFVIVHHSVRRQVLTVLRTLRQVLELFFLGFLLVLFFSLVGIILFPIYTEEGATYFPSLVKGMWSLLVLLTTANFPDVMLPAYRESRSAFLYFLIFMIVGMFFLVNALTAIVMSAYQQTLEVDRAHLKETRKKQLGQAYDLLTIDPDSGERQDLTISKMERVMKELSKLYYFDSEEMSHEIFSKVDSSGDGRISGSEFGSLIFVLSELVQKESPPPFLEKCFPNLSESSTWQAMKGFALSDLPGFFIDILLLINLIDMVHHLWPEILGTETPEQALRDRRAAIAGWMQHTFLCILVFESTMKILLLGFRRYLLSHINQFDFAITSIVLVIAIWTWLPFFPFDRATMARIAQCLRLFRFCRLLDRYKPYHHLGRIAFKLLPEAVDSLAVVTLICYVFAVLGMFLFGGIMNEDPANSRYAAIAKSDFGQANYYVNNFNDFGMSMVTLFELLVVNNWFIITDGFSAACGPFARVYFAAFWSLGVLVALNLLLSTIIGAFIIEYEEIDETHFRLPDLSPLYHGEKELETEAHQISELETASQGSGV